MSPPLRILAVDDDPDALRWLARALEPRHHVDTCSGGAAALDRLAGGGFDLVLTDLCMPAPDGLAVLDRARALERPVPVIVVSAMDTARAAVEALRRGAADFLVKPAEPAEIEAALGRVLPGRVSGATDPEGPDFGLIGASPAIRLIRRLVPALAQSRESVLLCGATGTGKELLARAIHEHGPRRAEPFVAHNMAATPHDLAESLFFGHQRGAFSGATQDHRGLFRMADRGTLFLDEVDSFPLPLQAKLLRVLESGEIQPVGASTTTAVDVRVIATSSADLCDAARRGLFRADLYYRLRQLEVLLPGLEDRRADIVPLIRHFLAEFARDTGHTPRLGAKALAALEAGHYPGNVRELRSAVRAAATLAGNDTIGLEHLPRSLREDDAAGAAGVQTLRGVERRHILRVLENAGGNRSLAARILGIDRGTLARKLADAPDPVSEGGA